MMKHQSAAQKSGFVVIFLICLGIGFFLAKDRPLWNDEIYTQRVSISSQSYWDIISRNIGEGNPYPLFYLIQKGICDVLRYQLPAPWEDLDWAYQHPPSQVLLRINPVFFMSLTIALIFYFFYQRYSLLAACYSFLVSLSTYMIWAFWAEARPYTLWIFLTTVQSILLIRVIEDKTDNKKIWNMMLGTHFLLSMTIFLSSVQICVASAMIWLFKERRWRKYIGLTVAPLTLIVAYYLNSAKHRYQFIDTPLELISANIPKDRMLIILGFVLCLAVYQWQKQSTRFKLFKENLVKEGGLYLFFTVLMICSFFAVLGVLKLFEGTGGFRVPSRYFIALTPIGIMAATLFPVHIFRALQGRRWLQVGVVLGVGFLLAFRFLRTYGLLQGIYPWLF